MKKIIRSFLVVSLFFLLIPEIIHAQRARIIRKAPAYPKKTIKYGLASYYAKKFHGRRTSDGSIYNARKKSAACNVLPLGSWVRVTNLRNKRSIIVKINDRLQRRSRRLIDLSKVAAEMLDYIKTGITRVKVELLNRPKAS